MDTAALVNTLLTTGEAAQAELIALHVPSRNNVPLARELHAAGQAAWNSEPMAAVRAASALRLLAEFSNDNETSALAAWMAGIASLVEGRMEMALAELDDAGMRFDALGLQGDAAATQAPKIMALGMLARYDEAIQTGLRARDRFAKVGDALAAGKVDLNLGHIYFRQDAYAEAEECYAQARDRFAQISSTEWLIAAQIALADVSAWQHRFGAASELYAQAEHRAREAGLSVLQATSALNAGHLALLQGRYDRALRDLERARRLYEGLQMDTDVALCEQKIADVYLELNLVPEAISIYARVVPQFERFDLPFEHAWGLTHYGRALTQAGQIEDARVALLQAHELFLAQNNAVCAAMANLGLAQAEFADSNFDRVAALTEQIEPALITGNWHSWLGMARWLHAESARRAGDLLGSRALCVAVLRDAERLPHIAQHCHTTLGLIAKAEGQYENARRNFEAAIELVERQRTWLQAEDFQISFVADKLLPYKELVRMHLDAVPPRAIEAMSLVEMWRARALLEVMQRTRALIEKPGQGGEAIRAQADQAQDELNWLYGQLRLALSDSEIDTARVAQLQAAAQNREGDLIALSRRMTHMHRERDPGSTETFDLARLQREIGRDTAVVVYIALEEDLVAVLITSEDVEVRRLKASVTDVEVMVNQFRFQTESMRYGSAGMRAHLPLLLRRTQHYLHQLHRAVLEPLLSHLGARRLIVAPDHVLHYVPFHALWNGQHFLIEEREVTITPSAAILLECLSRTRRIPRHAVLIGAHDERAPLVREEVTALAPLFESAHLLVEGDATTTALRAHAAQADVLHLACHGEFRSDAPLFSSLQLTDSRLTVRDAYDLPLGGALVTLSACETGVSAIAPGNEIIGLVRGFFAAGAPTVVVSLWAVDDASTAALMQTFYARLLAGDRPSAALRKAQLRAMYEEPHPFFWAPFTLFGQG